MVLFDSRTVNTEVGSDLYMKILSIQFVSDTRNRIQQYHEKQPQLTLLRLLLQQKMKHLFPLEHQKSPKVFYRFSYY